MSDVIPANAKHRRDTRSVSRGTLVRVIPLLLTMALVVPTFTFGADTSAGAGDEVEGTIRRLDLAEADAVLRGDFAAIDKLWAPDMIVNNPFNEVVRSSRGRVRTGAVTYASFVRQIESVQVFGDTAVAMGNEIVVPSGTSPGAGTTIRRRYTDVWTKRDGAWLLTARHANVICPN